MNNFVCLIGRLVDTPDVKNIDKENNSISITIAVNRNYKNSEGIYETDFFTCSVLGIMSKNICDYCKKGDLIGIKGRLQSNEYDDENGKRHFVTEVIAERVTFLSSKPKEEIEEADE